MIDIGVNPPLTDSSIGQCVGCGYCCMKTLCDAARRLYPGATLCPQLLWLDNRYECGLMKIGGPVGEGYRKELAAGAGCCSSLNSWRMDVKPRMTFDARSNMHTLDAEFQVFLKCWASEFLSGDVIQLTLAKMQRALVEQKNYSDEEASLTIHDILHHIEGNRHSYMKEFMG